MGSTNATTTDTWSAFLPVLTDESDSTVASVLSCNLAGLFNYKALSD